MKANHEQERLKPWPKGLNCAWDDNGYCKDHRAINVSRKGDGGT
jgi:hypothetical protein